MMCLSRLKYENEKAVERELKERKELLKKYGVE